MANHEMEKFSSTASDVDSDYSEISWGPPSSSIPSTTNITDPLSNVSFTGILQDTERFVAQHELLDHLDTFRKGGLLAKVRHVPRGYRGIMELSPQEIKALEDEQSCSWRSCTGKMWFLAAHCGGAGMLFGMEVGMYSVYEDACFSKWNTPGIWHTCWPAASLYVALAISAISTPWIIFLNPPRRRVLFLYMVSIIIWALATHTIASWPAFIISRCLSGLTLGGVLVMTLLYVSECAPTSARGSMCALFQPGFALGLLTALLVNLIATRSDVFATKPEYQITLRYMAVPVALVIIITQTHVPESPTWFLQQGNIKNAFESMCELRTDPIIAARDIYLMYKWQNVQPDPKLELEWSLQRMRKQWLGNCEPLREDFRAVTIVFLVMFLHVFSGGYMLAISGPAMMRVTGNLEYVPWAPLVGVAFAVVCSFAGFVGMHNSGRRRTVFTGLIFTIVLSGTGSLLTDVYTDWRFSMMVTYMVLLGSFSLGMGITAYTYTAEIFRPSFRVAGISVAVTINALLTAVLCLLLPPTTTFITPGVMSMWTGATSLIGLVLTYFFLPETQGYSLYEMGNILKLSHKEHWRHYYTKLQSIMDIILCKEPRRVSPLYELDAITGASHHQRQQA